jgi:hypothetical protein
MLGWFSDEMARASQSWRSRSYRTVFLTTLKPSSVSNYLPYSSGRTNGLTACPSRLTASTFQSEKWDVVQPYQVARSQDDRNGDNANDYRDVVGTAATKCHICVQLTAYLNCLE